MWKSPAAPGFKKGLALLMHPVFISLIVTLVILQIFPVSIPKYKVEIIESYRQESKALTVYDDLTHDGFSDKILFTNYPIGLAGMGVYFEPGGRVKEWDFHGRFVNEINSDFFLIDTVSSGEDKRIFVFTQSHDSLFLNQISDFSDRKAAWKEKFITTTRFVNSGSDAFIINPQLEDLDDNGFKELVFGISTGFSINPRAMFIFDLKKDSIIRGIEIGNSLLNYHFADLDGDKKKEIITMGYAPKNILDSIVQFHDSSIWVMVFDHNLQLEFTPPELEGRTGSTTAFTFPNKVSPGNFYVTWWPPTDNPAGVKLFRFSKSGDKELVKEFSEFDKNLVTNGYMLFYFNKDNKLIFPLRNGDIYLYDSGFTTYEIISLDHKISYLFHEDVDQDGIREFLVFDLVSNTLTVYREDFSRPATVEAELAHNYFTRCSVKKTNNKNPLISLSTGNLYYLLSYHKNPYWYAKWGIWVAIWLAVFLFALLIRKIQRIQIEKKYATEKKITELQLKVVRNQMDPHFTMNAINSVIDAVNRNEKEEATRNLLHFAKMYRSLVLSADQIKRTLGEELEFTRNYLELEKFRFRDCFDYSITLPPEVSIEWEVPKMIIQSPVENAIKHGLLNLDGRGMLKISGHRDNSHLILEITDNGIGRMKAREKGTGSTGKGMKIMEEFLGLYAKITGKKAETWVEDLSGQDGTFEGTKVIVKVEI